MAGRKTDKSSLTHQASTLWAHHTSTLQKTRSLPAGLQDCNPPPTRHQLQTCLGNTDKQNWMLK
jgi:hypothetical protein